MRKVNISESQTNRTPVNYFAPLVVTETAARTSAKG